MSQLALNADGTIDASEIVLCVTGPDHSALALELHRSLAEIGRDGTQPANLLFLSKGFDSRA